MHSGDKKQYLTTSDIAMLRRVLDKAGLPDEVEHPRHETRDAAARLMIGLFEQGITVENKLSEALGASMTASSPVTSPGYQMAREKFHSGLDDSVRRGWISLRQTGREKRHLDHLSCVQRCSGRICRVENGGPQCEDGGAGAENSQCAGKRLSSAMTARSANSVVTFTQPFKIGTQPEKLPAGAYNVTIDEELIEGLSFAAYHRVSTILEVPAIGTASAMTQYLHVSAEELDAALQRDRLSAESGIA